MTTATDEIATWRNKKVLVVGDVMLDRYIYGDVERISPEGPIPILRHAEEKTMLGGAGNVARNVVTLGGTAILMGVVGNDDAGKQVTAIAEANGVEGYFFCSASMPTVTKTRFISRGHQLLRLDVEQILSESDPVVAGLIDRVRVALPTADAIVLSDYLKGVLSPKLLREVIEMARSARLPVIVDPKSRELSRYNGANVITPNAKEASLATGLDCREDDGAEEAARTVRQIVQADAVVLTRGARGMTVLAPNDGSEAVVHIPTSASEVFDVSGAGDTVIAALALALSAGLPVERAAWLANAAAGVAVSKLGTAAVHAHELVQDLTHRNFAGIEGKICSPEDAAAVALRWRNEGLRVGFTNGCFDLIHPGHVALLQKARAACDRLIVALNSDASIKRLKGPSRPVQNEDARTLVMASIASVDLVTLFGEDTPLNVISAIRPDILIKGADYTLDEVVGADFVTQYGGKVALVPLESGHSTTSIISRVR